MLVVGRVGMDKGQRSLRSLYYNVSAANKLLSASGNGNQKNLNSKLVPADGAGSSPTIIRNSHHGPLAKAVSNR